MNKIKHRLLSLFERPLGGAFPSALVCSLAAGGTALAQGAGEAPQASTTQDALSGSPSLSIPPKLAKHEISLSGDFLYGQGTVTVPFAQAISKNSDFYAAGSRPVVQDPKRHSDYVGATLSYSTGQAWFFDVSYAKGSSSGDAPFTFVKTLIPTTFKIEDDWYQAYVRYTFPKLRGKKLSAYIRAGVSFVQADLTDVGQNDVYEETDKTQDIIGNLGFGLAYSLYSGDRLKVSLQLEGEGFYGQRSHDITEILPGITGSFHDSSLSNDLYGGSGRGTVRFQYALGSTGLLKVFADAGAQAKYTLIHYPKIGTPHELLWGPYVKLGLLYSF